MNHLIQPIYIGAPVFALKCFTRGNASVFAEGIMAYANWRTEMVVEEGFHPGLILTEEDDRIDYDNEPNTAIQIGVSCLNGFSISFESIGGVDYTDATLTVIQGEYVVFTETVRLYADPFFKTFERITTGLACVACGTILEISFTNAPDSSGVQLECFFNGISEFF
jgi:hypothetical protein